MAERERERERGGERERERERETEKNIERDNLIDVRQCCWCSRLNPRTISDLLSIYTSTNICLRAPSISLILLATLLRVVPCLVSWTLVFLISKELAGLPWMADQFQVPHQPLLTLLEGPLGGNHVFAPMDLCAQSVDQSSLDHHRHNPSFRPIPNMLLRTCLALIILAFLRTMAAFVVNRQLTLRSATLRGCAVVRTTKRHTLSGKTGAPQFAGPVALPTIFCLLMVLLLVLANGVTSETPRHPQLQTLMLIATMLRGIYLKLARPAAVSCFLKIATSLTTSTLRTGASSVTTSSTKWDANLTCPDRFKRRETPDAPRTASNLSLKTKERRQCSSFS